MCSAKRPEEVLLLYGSQSGNAENLTKQLKEDLERRGIECEMEAMNDVDVDDLKDKEAVIFLTSTAGQGEFPSNAKDFYTSLTSIQDKSYLKGLNFSVFGLGDHGYVYFNKAAKDLSNQLNALGATSLTPEALGDDRDDEKFETKYYEWLPALYESLHCQEVLVDSPPVSHYTATVSSTLEGKLKPFKPLRSHIFPLINTHRLTEEGYDRDIRHFEIDLTGTKVKYNLGDTLGIYPQNPASEVDKLLRDLGLNGADFVKIQKSEEIRRTFLPAQTTIQTLFTEVLDVFGRPSRRFYSMLSRLATDPAERSLLQSIMTKNGAAVLKEFSSETVTYADLLRQFRSAKPDLSLLLDLIPVMKPRYYSIASSPLMNPSSIQLCIVGVDWTTPKGVERHGQCTHYLRGLPSPIVNGQLVPTNANADSNANEKVTIRAAVAPGTMQMPPKTECPVIMAGLGTGIAPFKAITENRVAQARAGNPMGETILFYGCRYKKEFVYSDLWEAYEKEGVLTHVIPAFSREQSYKIYVQDRIRENAKLVSDALVKKGGYFYYCGLAGRAPAQIREGLRDAIAQTEGWTGEKAEEYLVQMEKEGRYNLECW